MELLSKLFDDNLQRSAEICDVSDAKLIFEGGRKLAESLVTISDDEVQGGRSVATIEDMRQESVTEAVQSVDDSYARRKELYVDRVNIAQMLEDQRAYLSMPKWTVKVTGNDIVQEIINDDVDGDGKSLIDLSLDMAVKAMAYRHCFCVVDRTADIPDGLTVADAESLDNPYCYLVDPDDIAVTYKTAKKSVIDTAIIRSMEVLDFIEQDGVRFPKDAELVYTLWTKDSIIRENAKGDRISERPNPLSIVPIVEMEMPNASLIYGMKSEVQACNFLFSLSVASMRTAIYGLLILYTNNKIKEMGTGNGMSICLDPGDSSDIVNTPTDATNTARDRSNDVLQGIREKFRNRQKSNSREVMTQSGESKKQDMIPQEAFLRQMSKIIEKAIIEITEMIQRYFGDKPVDVAVSVPDAFIQASLDEQLAKAKHLEDSYTPVDKYSWMAQKREARRLSVERSMSNDEIALSDEEIGKMAEDRFSVESFNAPIPPQNQEEDEEEDQEEDQE